MSETTPTAAEVMGWELVPSHSPDIWPPMWHGPNSEREAMRPKITPDDMLTWLRERGYWPIIGPQDDRPDWDLMEVELMYATDETDNGIGCQGFYAAPTLHAALEAAVIAVGSAQ